MQTINLFLAILKNTLPLHHIKVPPLETGADLMAALWEVFLFCKYKVSDYSLAFCFYMRPLHNTALAALLSTFRLGHLHQ